jgi:hypothetical protein
LTCWTLPEGSLVQNPEDWPRVGAPQALISCVSAFDALGLDPQNGAGWPKRGYARHDDFLAPQLTQDRQIDGIACEDAAHVSAGFQNQREHATTVSQDVELSGHADMLIGRAHRLVHRGRWADPVGRVGHRDITSMGMLKGCDLVSGRCPEQSSLEGFGHIDREEAVCRVAIVLAAFVDNP